MKKVPALLILSLVSLGLAVHAQTPAAKPAPPAPAAPAAAPKAAPPTELERKVQEVSRLVQAGKVTEAMPRLQALEKDPATTPPVRVLIGVFYLELGKAQEALLVLKPLADSVDAEPAALYQAGRAALAAGKRDEAKIYFTRSIAKEPSSPATRELGMLMAREGRVVEAYSMLRPWALHNPTDPDARLIAANLALTLERPAEAAEMLVGQPENDPAIQLLQGRVRVQKKDGPGAVALLQPLLAKHPKGMDLEIRRDLAEAQMLAGKPAEAVALLQGKTAGHPTLTLTLARAQRQAGNTAAAMATLQPLAVKIPNDPEVLGDPRPASAIALEYGTLLLDAGRAAEALPFLDKGARYNPRNADAWKTLARGLDANGKKEEAHNARLRAEEASKPVTRAAAVVGGAAAPAPQPEQIPLSPALQNALTLMSKGQLDGALAAVRQEIGVSNDPQARLLEVRILLTQKKAQEALKSTEAALKTNPNNPDYIYLRGAVEMSLQQYSAAETDLRKALQLSPRHTGAMSDLAVLLMNVNKKDEARRLLQQVLQINPQDKNAAANLERLNTEARQ